MNPDPKESLQLEALVDLASEEVLAWPDEEVRERAAEDGVDMESNAESLRRAIRERLDLERLSRLRAARAALDQEVETPSPRDESTFEQLSLRLREVVASGLMSNDSRLLVAARGGRDIDEHDLRSLLADYDELRTSQLREALTVASNETCPVSGVWCLDGSTITVAVAQGAQMPTGPDDDPVVWRLRSRG